MKKYTLWLLVLAGLILSACSKEEDVPGPTGPKQMTFILYIAAENSLGVSGKTFDYSNIRDLLKGVTPAHLAYNNIIIYHDPIYLPSAEAYDFVREDLQPRLYEVALSDEKVDLVEIEKFEEQNSASPEIFSGVLNKIFARYSSEKYGLLMWSHGTGWMPSPNYQGRAIGQDNNDWMEIHEFAQAIPDGKLEYIVFDACHMASVEVAYEIRKKAKYMLAPATETMGAGMPYTPMPNYLLGLNPNLKGYCDVYYDHFMTYQGGIYEGTVSLVDLTQVENLAAATKTALGDYDMDFLYSIPTNSMQYYDRIGYTHYSFNAMFDLENYLELAAKDETVLESFRKALSETVIYEKHGDKFLSLIINRHCGLSSYVPRNSGTNVNLLNNYYKTLGWYKAVYE